MVVGMHGRVDIIVTVLYQGVSPVMRSRGGCGFRCVGGPQKFRAIARPEHLLLIFLEKPLVIVVTHARVPHGIYWLSIVT